MICSSCNRISTKSNPVTKGPDPYQSDVHGDDTPVWLCTMCREELVDEV